MQRGGDALLRSCAPVLAPRLRRMKRDPRQTPGHRCVTPPGSEPGPAVAVSTEEVTDPGFPPLPALGRSPQPPSTGTAVAGCSLINPRQN